MLNILFASISPRVIVGVGTSAEVMCAASAPKIEGIGSSISVPKMDIVVGFGLSLGAVDAMKAFRSDLLVSTAGNYAQSAIIIISQAISRERIMVIEHTEIDEQMDLLFEQMRYEASPPPEYGGLSTEEAVDYCMGLISDEDLEARLSAR